MKRHNMIVIALGTLAVTAAAVPFTPANAQSGDALAQAERTCIDNGLRPGTAFDTCVSRAALDYDRGLPEIAVRDAAMVRSANDVCQSYGIAPMSLGYRQCVGNELEKSTIQAYTINVPDYEVPHATAAIDRFGFRYDAEGNVLDNDGFVIRAVP
jgi:hypothetical protein